MAIRLFVLGAACRFVNFCERGKYMLDPNTTAALAQLGIDAQIAEAAISSLLVLTVITVAAAVPTGILAKRKGRSVAFWVVFALSIPVIPLLWIALLSKLDSNK